MSRRGAVRRQPCRGKEALSRLKQADGYLEVAKTVISDSQRPEKYSYNHVAAGIAVLAAVAASDAICCELLGERSRGQDHHDAISLLGTIRYGSESGRLDRARRLAEALRVALAAKDESHYGLSLLGPTQVRKAVRAAEQLVAAGHDVLGKSHL
jgi:hypothetical protein